MTFTWSSSATSVATVSGDGVATGVAPGDATITATAPNAVAGTAALHVNAPSTPGLPAVRFSELHYDNFGTDAGEAIEIEGPAGTSLAGWSVVLYNGNGGVQYNTQTLSGTIAESCSGRGVVVVSYPQDGIQNGSPDGMALVNASGQVVEFLSYEGDVHRDRWSGRRHDVDGHWRLGDLIADRPIAAAHRRRRLAGAGDVDVRRVQRDRPPAHRAATSSRSRAGRRAIRRCPWASRIRSSRPCAIHPARRSSTTVTWTSETPAIATIDQNGVFTALAAGTATFRATAADG